MENDEELNQKNPAKLKIKIIVGLLNYMKRGIKRGNSVTPFCIIKPPARLGSSQSL